jgi:hypothetical protein
VAYSPRRERRWRPPLDTSSGRSQRQGGGFVSGGTVFILLCIIFYANVSRCLRHIFQFMAPFHIMSVYDIFIHILRKCLLILCIISLPNLVCILGSYHLSHMYKIFTTHAYATKQKITIKVSAPGNKVICYDFIKSRACNPLVYGVHYYHKKIILFNQSTSLNS